MVKASMGLRRGTRRKFKRGPREKFTVSRKTKEFKQGDKVIISIDPSTQGGSPPSVYLGVTGTVKGSRGRAYLVFTSLGNKSKKLLLRPEHLLHYKERYNGSDK